MSWTPDLPDTPLSATFRTAFKGVDGFKIGQTVDEEGIGYFISKAAMLAGMSGAAAGSGGGATLVFALPADLANLVLQMFRVTLAVIYERTGSYTPTLEQALRVMAIGVGAGFALKLPSLGAQKALGKATESALVAAVSKEVAKSVSAKAAGRIIPFLGGAVGAVLNYSYIEAYGAALLAITSEEFDDLLL